MATFNFDCPHVSVSKKRIRVFDTVLPLNGKIEVSATFSLDLNPSTEGHSVSMTFLDLASVKQVDILSSLEGPVLTDKSAGKVELIDHLLLTSEIAVIAIYGGFLTKKHLAKLVSREDGTLFIPGILLCGLLIDFVIIPEKHSYLERLQGYEFATIDREGNIV